MKRGLALFLFPYLAPLISLSVLFFIYLLVTPYQPADGTGPAGSDVLGLYFIGACIVMGGVLQVVFGVPLNLVLMRIQLGRIRWIVYCVSTLIPVALYAPILIDTPSSIFEAALSIIIIVVTFGLGTWVSALILG